MLNSLCLVLMVLCSSSLMSEADIYERFLDSQNYIETMKQTKLNAINFVINVQKEKFKDEQVEGQEEFYKDLENIIGTLWDKHFSLNDLKDYSKKIIIGKFTDDELEELIKFNRSSLGQKMLRVMPEFNNSIIHWQYTRQEGFKKDMIASVEAAKKKWLERLENKYTKASATKP